MRLNLSQAKAPKKAPRNVGTRTEVKRCRAPWWLIVSAREYVASRVGAVPNAASKMSGGGGQLRPVTPPSRLSGPNGHRTLVRSSCEQRVPRLTPPDKIRHSDSPSQAGLRNLR